MGCLQSKPHERERRGTTNPNACGPVAMSKNPLHKTTGRTLRERQQASAEYLAAGTIDAGSFEAEMPPFDEAAVAGYLHVSPSLLEIPTMQIDMLQVSLTETGSML